MFNLLDAEVEKPYKVKEINVIDDDEIQQFLFRLGCYPGESITLITKKRKTCIVVIKNARYAIDNKLASLIILEESEK